ncbi:MAG: tyrosine-type recombinase/integrase [Candidatus Krumholzibacteriota bacterium]|nr:tyrosine-type recombinase/integrase [Candidatus Krumholzibacteriota bacterium]
METDLITHNAQYRPLAATKQEILEEWLAGRSENTRRTYRAAWEHFARWLGELDLDAASAWLLSVPFNEGNAILYKYKLAMREERTRQGKPLAPGTINVRLTAIRSLVRLSRSLGLTPWAPEVPGEKVECDDSRLLGPELAVVQAILSGLKSLTDPKGRRDYAIVRLLADLGLRRDSVIGLDLENIDLGAGTLRTRLKGRSGLHTFSLPPETAEALEAWLLERGPADGPAFPHLSRSHPPGRLTGRGLAKIIEVRSLQFAGVRVRPHGLRHAFATRARDLGIPIDEVAVAMRHSNLATVQRYDDARRNRDEKVGRKVAASYGV